jgi:hypothetical protein
MAATLFESKNPPVCPTCDLGRSGMLQWKVRLAVAAALLLAVVGADFDWLRQFGW